MEVRAIGRYIRVQPRKVRIVADEVRGKNAVQAVHILRFHPSKSAQMLRKVLVSAISNAQENNNLSIENLKITRIQVDEGPRMKRIQARAQGRANRIVKKTSHITVCVEEAEPTARIKPHGTKAKARRTLDAPKKSKKAEKAEAAPVEEPIVEAAVEETAPVEEVVAEAATTEEVAAETPAEEEVVAEAPAEPEAKSEEENA